MKKNKINTERNRKSTLYFGTLLFSQAHIIYRCGEEYCINYHHSTPLHLLNIGRRDKKYS